MTGMTEQPIDKKKLAQEKRDLARRARRLAQLQAEPDSARLTQFAAELDREAEALERLAAATMQQVQQQQSGETPTQPQLPKRNDQGLRSNHPRPRLGVQVGGAAEHLAAVCGMSPSRYACNK
jgi:hypothetical protein